MAFYTKLVDIDLLRSGHRTDTYNSLATNPLGFDLRVTGTLDSVVVTFVNPFTSPPTTIVLTEGVDFDNDADPVVTLKNLIVAIVGAADSPLKPSGPVLLDGTDGLGRVNAFALSSASKAITLAATTANASNLDVNNTSGPHTDPEAASNGSPPNAEVQLAIVLNALSPAPTDISAIRIIPIGIEDTTTLIIWEA